MYLLNEVANNKRFTPIAVHINYNFREESKDEQTFVEEYCKSNNIKLYTFEVDEENWNEYKYLGNKQSMARQFRYDKYFEVADKEDTDHIFIAHHKDDFIETAIMQENKSNDYLYFGIQQNNKIGKYKITRPLINLWKKEIVDSLDERNIEYKIDKSNLEPIYERNKIRLELNKLTINEKQDIFNRFEEINKSKEELRQETDKYYEELINSELDWNTYNSIPQHVKRYVVYKFLINSKERMNISSDKLDSIVEFLDNKRGDKSYRLMEKVFLSVKNSKIIVYNK